MVGVTDAIVDGDADDVGGLVAGDGVRDDPVSTIAGSLADCGGGLLISVLARAKAPAKMPPTSVKTPVTTAAFTISVCETYQLLIPIYLCLPGCVSGRGQGKCAADGLAGMRDLPYYHGMHGDASSQPHSHISRYTGPLVVGLFAVQAAIAGGISEAFRAEGPADTSFMFAGVCAVGALGGALFAHRTGRDIH